MNFNNTNKTIGYILLFAGLLLIIIPVYQAYHILAGGALPVQIFKQSFDAAQNKQKVEITSPNNPFDIQQQTQKALMSVLPIDLINNTLNLGIWMMLMWILILAGSKIAGLGIRLLKNES